MQHNNKLAGVAVLITVIAAPVSGDDTEIFVGSEEAGKKPNVLFVTDTSGSMDIEEEIAQSPYDPSVDYDGDCVDGRIYWRNGSNPPASCDTHRWISEDASVCDDINDAVSSDSGLAVSVAAQDRGNFIRWLRLQPGNHDDDVDCRRGLGGGTYRFFSANYMNWYHSEDGGTETMTRMEIVQDIGEDLVDSLSGVRIGLMRFDRGPGSSGRGDQWNGGYVDLEVDDVADGRDAFKSKLGSYSPVGATPLSETLYEAGAYLRGDNVHYGNRTRPGHSTPGARDGQGGYASPIEHECQKNHVVYLTDGEPDRDGDADPEIENLVGSQCGGNCFDELAGFLHAEDQNSDVDGTNSVTTHTVGFHTDQDLLRDAAQNGGGKYYTADSYSGLKDALTTVFTEILSGTSLFTAPAVSVNHFNRLEHLDEVYFALFRPDGGAVWRGNVKRYELSDTGELVDAEGRPAIDGATGEFEDTIRSFWSDLQDGNDVRLGGAAGELATTRDLYTYTGDERNVDLTADPARVLSEDNGELSTALLGLEESQDDYREKLLRWARGVDVDDVDGDGDSGDAREQMGDPLHSRPALVTYGEQNDPRMTLFLSTNEGYVHAIDTEDGSELWGFMPKELLPTIRARYENAVTGDRVYGLDGPMTTDTDEGTRLYFGMRRGGRSYYALDVSDRERPELMWTITGGEGDFGELGQTWSKPIPTTVDIGGSERDVLIFGGGYDPGQDEYAVRTADSQGRAIYIVDAATGELVWSGGHPDGDHEEDFSMDYSIPSDIRVLDVDSDGLADQMYVGDMGGQVWRFDIHNGEALPDLVTGGAIADLSADENPVRNRRFYYPPDVALINDDGQQWFSISLGSGWRAHPLDDQVEDRFFMIRNRDIFGPPRDDDDEPVYETLGNGDLYDATDNLIGEGTEQESQDALDELSNKEGWFIELENPGEKVMAESVTIDGQVIFTTYQPEDDGQVASCAPGQGVGRTYLVDVIDATPIKDLDEDGRLTAPDRMVQLGRGGIPPSPTVVFVNGETVVMVGPEQPVPDLDDGDRKRRIYWRQ